VTLGGSGVPAQNGLPVAECVRMPSMTQL
jgi:hypothetical protein